MVAALLQLVLLRVTKSHEKRMMNLHNGHYDNDLGGCIPLKTVVVDQFVGIIETRVVIINSSEVVVTTAAEEQVIPLNYFYSNKAHTTRFMCQFYPDL